MTRITYKENNINSCIGAEVSNAQNESINVRLNWGYTAEAPTEIYLNAEYKTPQGGATVSITRAYHADGTYSPEDDSFADIFDAAFDAAAADLVAGCFDNYSSIELISVEG